MFKEVPNLLLLHRPTIVHIACHADQHGIYFPDEDDHSRLIEPYAMQSLFAAVGESVRMVILNGRNTVFTARALRSVVEYSIGMGDNLTDKAAVAFAEGFYSSLAAGATIEQAFAVGSNEMQMELPLSDPPTLLVHDRTDVDEPLTTTIPSEKAPPPTAQTDLNEERSERSGVFISYSHADKMWLDRLRVHLRPLERDHSLSIWDDNKIKPGSDWRAEIRLALRRTKVAILLVSADFLASDFIATDELPPLLRAAKEEGALILPVIVSPCRFTKTSNLSGFQAVNDPAKPLKAMNGAGRERVLVDVAESVEAAFK